MSWRAPVLCAGALLGIVTSYFLRNYEVVSLEPAADARPNRIIVLVADGLRLDRISALGYPRPTTPNLDRLFGVSTFFQNCQAQAPTTLASHATIVTGMHPRSHGVRHDGHALREASVTLAEALHQSGYKTAAFLDSPELSRAPEHASRFEQGFDVFDAAQQPDAPENSGFARYFGALSDFLVRSRGEKSFVYIDTRATCAPYFAEEVDRAALAGSQPVVPEGAAIEKDPLTYLAALSTHDSLRPENYTSLAEIIDSYDAAVHRFDRQVAALFGFLVERNLLDDALIVVVSAHGESLLDRGLYIGHGLTVYQEEVAVPLWIRFPKGEHAGKRVPDVVRLMDVMPTICGVAGVGAPTEMEGKSLLEILAGDPPAAPRIATGEAVTLAAKGIDGIDGYTFYRRDGARKWIGPSRIGIEELYSMHLDRERSDPGRIAKVVAALGLAERFIATAQLYDLANDPHERADLGAKDPDGLAAALAAERSEEIPRERRRERLRRASESATPGGVGETEESIRELVDQKFISEEEGERRIAELRRNKR